MATTLRVKLGDITKNLRFSTFPQPSLTDVLSSIFESLHLGECTATFADDFGNLHTLDDFNLGLALEIMARGQSMELVLTKKHAQGNEQKCETVTCSFAEDEESSQNYHRTTFLVPGKGGGKGWHKAGLGKGSWMRPPWCQGGGQPWGKGKGTAWMQQPWFQGKGWHSWTHDSNSHQEEPVASAYHDAGWGDVGPAPSNFSISDSELEWKIAVLRRMSGISCSALLSHALLASHGNLQQAVDAVMG